MGVNADGTFSASEGSTQTTTGNETGNIISGVYTHHETASNVYPVMQTDHHLYTMTENGSLSSTTVKTGNTVKGSFDSTVTGNDSYTMTESGTNPLGQSFTQTANRGRPFFLRFAYYYTLDCA